MRLPRDVNFHRTIAFILKHSLVDSYEGIELPQVLGILREGSRETRNVLLVDSRVPENELVLWWQPGRFLRESEIEKERKKENTAGWE